jgi:hypothetical protein
MLKLLFWCLLLANAALVAYHQGYLNTLVPDGREPNRAAKQLNADKVKLIPASAAAGAATSALDAAPLLASAMLASNVAPNTLPNKPQDNVVACTEIGNFDAVEAKRFEARLATLSLGDRLSRRNVADGVRHMVFIPTQGSKEGADKKASELRQLGVTDFYVIQENTDMRWGVSLGIFKSAEAARTHLALLNQRGVRSARLGEYNATPSKIAFQLRELDAGAIGSVERIRSEFPGHETRGCTAVTTQP